MRESGHPQRTEDLLSRFLGDFQEMFNIVEVVLKYMVTTFSGDFVALVTVINASVPCLSRPKISSPP